MGLKLEYQEGQTPLEEDEMYGLLIDTISTRGELDEFEQQNIENALLWVANRQFTAASVFTDDFIRRLHKRMYGDVWAWAGQWRNTNKNIGVDFWQIPVQLRQLLEDALNWDHHNTYPPAEMALRFKHQLVSIHCFRNGNGRHSRLMADILIEKIYKQPVFTWETANHTPASDARKEYLKSVKAADKGDYRLLLDFARS